MTISNEERNEIIDKVIDCINLLLVRSEIGNKIRQWVKDKMSEDMEVINKEVDSIFKKLDEISTDSENS